MHALEACTAGWIGCVMPEPWATLLVVVIVVVAVFFLMVLASIQKCPHCGTTHNQRGRGCPKCGW